MKITINELRKLIKSVIKEEKQRLTENTIDPEREKFFNNLTNQIASKLLNKKLLFGKIGVFDNASIIIQNVVDRNHAVNLKDKQVYSFDIWFNVRRVEEDLYSNESPGARIWNGTMAIEAKFNVSGGIDPYPKIRLFLREGSKTYFDHEITPSRKISWDEVGGRTLWMSATKFNTYS